ncbi:MAG: PaaI family thioesterase [Acidimicrobiia bacterium]|nr:PaaI family thioesterase [Acidimicrobiia bacterium]
MYRYLSGDVVEIPDHVSELPRFHLATCFVCGPDTVEGLGLYPHRDGDRVAAELSFPKRFEGGPGLVHGGAVAAFFDDLMGYVLLAHGVPAVTAKLEMNYLVPIELDSTLHGVAWLAHRDGRKLYIEGEGIDTSGVRAVEASAMFLEVGLDHFTKRFEEGEYYP